MSSPNFDPVDGKRIDSPSDPWEQPRRMMGTREEDLGVGDRLTPAGPPVRRPRRADELALAELDAGSRRLLEAAGALEAGRLLEEPDFRLAGLDNRPHSRACGLSCPGHGPHCSPDCPTCGVRRPPVTPGPRRFYAGGVTIARSDLEYQPSMVDVIRAEQAAAAKAAAAHAELDELAPSIAAPVSSSLSAPVGSCGHGDHNGALTLAGRPAWCVLPRGHGGAHKASDGMEWDGPALGDPALPSSRVNARHDLANALGCQPGELMPPWADLLAEVRSLRRRSERAGW